MFTMLYRSIYFLIVYCISNIFSFQARIYLEKAGTMFLPIDPSAVLLDTESVQTTMACVYKCYNYFECRTFNFDRSTNQCQLFEGDRTTTGSMIEESSSTFIAGYIEISEQDFETYNQSCNQCDGSRFLTCVNGQCNCQPHTFWNGTMCLPQSPVPCTECQQTMNMCRLDMGLTCQSYNICDYANASCNSNNMMTLPTPIINGTLPFYGVQFNLSPSALPVSWNQCHSSAYNVQLIGSYLTSILNTCNKTKLLLGCRPINTTILTVAAVGMRSDVLYNCSTLRSCIKAANGVGWYYSDRWSWGFSGMSDVVVRYSCDIVTNTSSRLCWHTGQTVGGYRCGATLWLNSDPTTERVIYHSD